MRKIYKQRSFQNFGMTAKNDWWKNLPEELEDDIESFSK